MLQIRQATQADVEAIATIHVAAWRATYRGILPDSLLDGLQVSQRALLWSGWISGEGVHTLLACRDAKILAFSRLSSPRPIASPPRSSAEITHLYVDPGEQGHGAGRKLLDEALRIAKQEGYRIALLWTLEQNHRARAFYERYGFLPDGAQHTDPDYLGNDALEVRYQIDLVESH